MYCRDRGATSFFYYKAESSRESITRSVKQQGEEGVGTVLSLLFLLIDSHVMKGGAQFDIFALSTG